jgi:hypothetical protein
VTDAPGTVKAPGLCPVSSAVVTAQYTLTQHSPSDLIKAELSNSEPDDASVAVLTCRANPVTVTPSELVTTVIP